MLSPIELEYVMTFGKMPDFHYQELKRQGTPQGKTAEIIQKNINQCYKAMRERHEKKELMENPFYVP